MGKGSPVPAIVVGAFVALGGFLFGYDTGTISGVKEMKPWLQQFGTCSLVTDPVTNVTSNVCTLSSALESEVVSILSAGEFIGALLGAFLADAIGRRYGLSASSLVFMAGVVMQTAASELILFSIGRFVAGLGVGLISCIVPLYQSESAPKWIRGAIVGAYQWTITIGLLVAAIVNKATTDRPDSSSYRIPIGIQLAFGIILGGGVLFLPESPRWYVRNGKDDEALKSLAFLNSSDVTDAPVVEEFNNIKTNLEEERNLGSVGYADCFRMGGSRKMALRTWSGIWLQALQQLTGVNFIFYYGTTFFKRAGFSDPFIITVIVNVVNVVSTVPGMWAIDKFGRRPLLIAGAVGMLVAQFIVAGTAAGVGTENTAGQNTLIAFVCIYIFFFASTWGPLAWVVTSEIFPLEVRAKALSMTTASNWAWNFVIGYVTPYMVNAGPGNANMGSNVFFLWGSMCTVCAVFSYFFIFETKGISLEQVDELFATTTAPKSAEVNQRLRTQLAAADSVDVGVKKP